MAKVTFAGTQQTEAKDEDSDGVADDADELPDDLPADVEVAAHAGRSYQYGDDDFACARR